MFDIIMFNSIKTISIVAQLELFHIIIETIVIWFWKHSTNWCYYYTDWISMTFFVGQREKKTVVANQWPVIVGSMLIAIHKLEIIQPKISIWYKLKWLNF